LHFLHRTRRQTTCVRGWPFGAVPGIARSVMMRIASVSVLEHFGHAAGIVTTIACSLFGDPAGRPAFLFFAMIDS
jgi:hypothetical protein